MGGHKSCLPFAEIAVNLFSPLNTRNELSVDDFIPVDLERAAGLALALRELTRDHPDHPVHLTLTHLRVVEAAREHSTRTLLRVEEVTPEPGAVLGHLIRINLPPVEEHLGPSIQTP